MQHQGRGTHCNLWLLQIVSARKKTPGPSPKKGRALSCVAALRPYFMAWTIWSDFSTCSSGERLSVLEERVATTLPLRSIT